MDKKAQQSRADLFLWYGLCILFVFASVGALYGIGFVDAGTNSNTLGGSKITGAFVAVPNHANLSSGINETKNISLLDSGN